MTMGFFARVVVYVCIAAISGMSAALSAQEAPPAPPADHTYAVQGRRDPFVRTVGRTSAPAPRTSVRPQGVAGVLVSEVTVRGFLESRGTWVAMIGGPDGRSYTLRPGDRLMDGVVRDITSDAVIILQDVSDSPSSVKQREVRKVLRGGDQIK
jgi:Tfp pilus assembly protein PilP